MNRSVAASFGSLIALSFAVSACSGADSGSSADPNGQGTGGGFGGLMGGGGYVPGAGGYVPGGGGYVPGGGGANPGGGTNPGSGGANPNGGAPPGSGGAPPGSGGAPPGGGGAPPGGGGAPPGSGGAASSGACITDPANQAVILGDSYVTGFNSPPLQPALATIIPSISKYPNYAGAGCSMASGGICTGLYGNVPQQATTAEQQHPGAKLAIMDGGGNDILICSAVTYPNCGTVCKSPGSSTQKVCTDIVDLAITTAGKLMTDAANAGIRDTVYFFYPHLPGANAGYSEILDYAEPKAKALCDSAESTTGGKLRCHFVDMVQPFKDAGGDGNPANFAADSIHPSAAGQAIIAKAVTDVMTANCLGESSGCCSQ